MATHGPAFALASQLVLRPHPHVRSCIALTRRRYQVRAQLPLSVADFRDPRTGARICVVGCVHGSQVSADDVRTLLDETCPDAVVVELCKPRLAFLKTEFARQIVETRRRPLSSKRRRTFSQISTSFGGAGPALVAVVLELVYELQVLVGVKPGLEFAYAISESTKWSLVCGDAPARDTVRNLYDVLRTPLASLRQATTCIDMFLQPLMYPSQKGVNIPLLFLAEPARLRELARLTLPALVCSATLALAGTAGASALDAAPGIAVLSRGYAMSVWPLVAAIAHAVGVSYLIVSAMRLVKVLIADRDGILATSVLETVESVRGRGVERPTVCAVVGLLHVNGIVRHIEERGKGRE